MNLGNILSSPNRWMAYWLRRQGWVCFYLEPQCRFCPSAQNKPVVDCWLALYEQSERDR